MGATALRCTMKQQTLSFVSGFKEVFCGCVRGIGNGVCLYARLQVLNVPIKVTAGISHIHWKVVTIPCKPFPTVIDKQQVLDHITCHKIQQQHTSSLGV